MWRRLSDISEHVVDESSAPDEIQREVNNLICERHPSPNNGCFRPWAVCAAYAWKHQCISFRLPYPHCHCPRSCLLWDVPSGKLIQTLHGCQFIGSEGLWLRHSIVNTWRISQNVFPRMKLDCINNLGRRIDPILKEILILESKIGKVPTLHQVFFY